MPYEYDDSYDYDADNILSFDDVFVDTEQQLNRFRLLANIGSNADALIARLKSERLPDYADNTFVFNEDQLLKALPKLPRMVDTLVTTQYSLKELSVSFQRDFTKDTHGITISFGLSDKHDPDGELNTLIARRSDLRTPNDTLADTFTYPQNATRRAEESMQFPTLSSSDLRKLIASLLPNGDQSMYELYDDWIQAPENFEFMIQSLSLRDCTHIADSTYKLHSPVGEDLGKFTYSTFNDELISVGLEAPEGPTIATYDITLGQLPPPTNLSDADAFDDFYSEKSPRDVLNNDESPVMVRRFIINRNIHAIPQAANTEELVQINDLFKNNNPSLHKQRKEQPYGNMVDITDITDDNGVSDDIL